MKLLPEKVNLFTISIFCIGFMLQKGLHNHQYAVLWNLRRQWIRKDDIFIW